MTGRMTVRVTLPMTLLMTLRVTLLMTLPIILLTILSAAGLAQLATTPADSSGVLSAGAQEAAAATTSAGDLTTAMPVLPDTVWAQPLGHVATLDSALAQQAQLVKEGFAAFARIRASSTTYWYEVFAGPVVTRAEADTLVRDLQRRGWVPMGLAVRAPYEDLLLGVVGQPTRRLQSARRSQPAETPEAAGTGLPRIVQLLTPTYPPDAREAGIAGVVQVRVLIGETGQVIAAEVAESVHPLLDAAALEAAQKSLYAPAVAGGQPVQEWLTVPFQFK